MTDDNENIEEILNQTLNQTPVMFLIALLVKSFCSSPDKKQRAEKISAFRKSIDTIIEQHLAKSSDDGEALKKFKNNMEFIIECFLNAADKKTPPVGGER